MAFGMELARCLFQAPAHRAASFSRENLQRDFLGFSRLIPELWTGGDEAIRYRGGAERRGGHRGALRGWMALGTTLGYLLAPTSGFTGAPSSCSLSC